STVRDIAPPRAVPAQSAVHIYLLQAPTATAVVPTAVPAAAPLRSMARTLVRSGPAWVAGPVSGAANGFAYGYCTWWVAHKRYVPWRGNAAQWWWNARALDHEEGSWPRA